MHVQNVLPGSPAQAAGLEVGDKVYVAGREIGSAEQLQEVMSANKAGDTIQIAVVRDGWKKSMEITLASQAAILGGSGSGGGGEAGGAGGAGGIVIEERGADDNAVLKEIREKARADARRALEKAREAEMEARHAEEIAKKKAKAKKEKATKQKEKAKKKQEAAAQGFRLHKAEGDDLHVFRTDDGKKIRGADRDGRRARPRRRRRRPARGPRHRDRR